MGFVAGWILELGRLFLLSAATKGSYVLRSQLLIRDPPLFVQSLASLLESIYKLKHRNNIE